MCTECLAAGQYAELQAVGSQANIDIDIEDANHRELPPGAFLCEIRFLLEPGEQIVFFLYTAGVVP